MDHQQTIDMLEAIDLDEDGDNLDPLMVLEIVKVESSFNHRAVNRHSGARGLMGIMNGGSRDPFENILQGKKILVTWKDYCRSHRPREYLSVYGGTGRCTISAYSRKILRRTARDHRKMKRLEKRIVTALSMVN